MDWFERLTGFRETDYDDTRGKLVVEGDRLRSLVNGWSWGIGRLELVSLRELRERAAAGAPHGRPKIGLVRGDVRTLHGAPGSAGALFQVASQFNLLEMTGPSVTPEDGVTRYAADPTQGPACAIAAGAATIFRNYFAPVGGRTGQTADRQLDGLADVGAALSAATGRPVDELWRMRNGYALCHSEGLAAIADHLLRSSDDERDDLRARLRIGLHRDVEITDDEVAAAERTGPPASVSQVFCSALPVAYCAPAAHASWAPFATLVLEAAYEATMLSAALNAQRGVPNVVYLTLLGGGAFGNDLQWILDALGRALALAARFDLDVRIVTRGEPPPGLLDLLRPWRFAT